MQIAFGRTLECDLDGPPRKHRFVTEVARGDADSVSQLAGLAAKQAPKLDGQGYREYPARRGLALPRG